MGEKRVSSQEKIKSTENSYDYHKRPWVLASSVPTQGKESQERSEGIITTSPNITYFSVSKRKGDFSNVLSNVLIFTKSIINTIFLCKKSDE